MVCIPYIDCSAQNDIYLKSGCTDNIVFFYVQLINNQISISRTLIGRQLHALSQMVIMTPSWLTTHTEYIYYVLPIRITIKLPRSGGSNRPAIM